MRPCLRRRHSGSSLAEILVGLTIGMIALLAIVRVMLLAQGQGRTTAGSLDALNSGALALLQVERDVRQAGHGINVPGLLGCALTLRPGIVLDDLGPVTINPAGIPAAAYDAGTDRLLLVSGSGGGSPEGAAIVSQDDSRRYALAAPSGFAARDWVVAQAATRDATCSLKLDRIVAAGATPPSVTVAGGVAGMADGTLYDLGTAPTVVVYAIHDGSLVACDYMTHDCGSVTNAGNANVWVPLADGIVSLAALLGRDAGAPQDGVADVYDQATPATACAWNGVLASRIALVARNPAFEKASVTSVAPLWTGSAIRALNLGAGARAGSDWQHYRYQVFETTVPVRNMTWRGDVTGCGAT